MSVCANDADGDGNCAACARNPEAPCRVSARESIENLWDRATPVGPLLDAYAHELAEKIRAAGCQEVNWCGCPRAADLIDPEVLNSGEAGAVQPS